MKGIIQVKDFFFKESELFFTEFDVVRGGGVSEKK